MKVRNADAMCTYFQQTEVNQLINGVMVQGKSLMVAFSVCYAGFDDIAEAMFLQMRCKLRRIRIPDRIVRE